SLDGSQAAELDAAVAQRIAADPGACKLGTSNYGATVEAWAIAESTSEAAAKASGYAASHLEGWRASIASSPIAVGDSREFEALAAGEDDDAASTEDGMNSEGADMGEELESVEGAAEAPASERAALASYARRIADMISEGSLRSGVLAQDGISYNGTDQTTSETQSKSAAATGLYRIDLLGAAGGSAYIASNTLGYGGSGGRTTVYVFLKKSETVYFSVGGGGGTHYVGSAGYSNAAWNGGGKGYSSANTSCNYSAGGGGGATCASFYSEQGKKSLSEAYGTNVNGANVKKIIGIAGGGGGGTADTGSYTGAGAGGAGGGVTSGDITNRSGGATSGYRATQSSATFLAATDAASGARTGGGNGGGWYTRGTGTTVGGAGGSGHIGGATPSNGTSTDDSVDIAKGDAQVVASDGRLDLVYGTLEIGGAKNTQTISNTVGACGSAYFGFSSKAVAYYDYLNSTWTMLDVDAFEGQTAAATQKATGVTATSGNKPFVGWSVDKDDSVPDYLPGDAINESCMLYPVYGNDYSVEFDMGAHAAASLPASSSVSNIGYTLPEAKPAGGYAFLGWKVQYLDGGDTVYSDTLPAGTTVSPSQGSATGWADGDGAAVPWYGNASDKQAVTTGTTVKLVAQWTDYEPYTVAFSPGSDPAGTGEMAAGGAHPQAGYVVPECGFDAPSGYEFRGWVISGSDRIAYPGETYTKSDTPKWVNDQGNPVAPGSTVTLVASWRTSSIVVGGTAMESWSTSTAGTYTFTAGEDGFYSFDLTGGGGGGSKVMRGGDGGRTKGTYYLPSGTTLYIGVGGGGGYGVFTANNATGGTGGVGGYNGGGTGSGYETSGTAGGGGGATTVSTASGEISDSNLQVAYNSLLAAGGGGGPMYRTGHWSGYVGLGGGAGTGGASASSTAPTVPGTISGGYGFGRNNFATSNSYGGSGAGYYGGGGFESGNGVAGSGGSGYAGAATDGKGNAAYWALATPLSTTATSALISKGWTGSANCTTGNGTLGTGAIVDYSATTPGAGGPALTGGVDGSASITRGSNLAEPYCAVRYRDTAGNLVAYQVYPVSSSQTPKTASELSIAGPSGTEFKGWSSTQDISVISLGASDTVSALGATDCEIVDLYPVFTDYTVQFSGGSKGTEQADVPQANAGNYITRYAYSAGDFKLPSAEDAADWYLPAGGYVFGEWEVFCTNESSEDVPAPSAGGSTARIPAGATLSYNSSTAKYYYTTASQQDPVLVNWVGEDSNGSAFAAAVGAGSTVHVRAVWVYDSLSTAYRCVLAGCSARVFAPWWQTWSPWCKRRRKRRRRIAYSPGFLRISSSGKWVGVLKYRDIDGKWRQKTHTFTRNRAESEKALSQWREQLTGEHITPSSTAKTHTVEQAVRACLNAQLARKRIEQSTYATQLAYAERSVFPKLGEIPLAALTPDTVQKWVDELCLEMSAGSVRLAYGVLHKTCSRAATRRELAENPLDRIELPAKTRPKRAFLPETSIALLEKALSSEWGQGHPRSCAVTLALHAGLRAGECCGLRWRDVETDAGRLRVVASVGRSAQGVYLKSPKCDASAREFPIVESVASSLAARALDAGGSPDPSNFVCGSETFSDPRRLSYEFSRLCERAGVVDDQGRRATFHSLRRTFATRAVRAGVDPRTLADMMGHADAGMTLNVYAASGEEAKSTAVAKMQMALS
ncbi:MAG: site-specific integrase, partial [Eggerthellaceae bacterium]|nr:site-specific integrase [Eggerthellaceae bacterium]